MVQAHTVCLMPAAADLHACQCAFPLTYSKVTDAWCGSWLQSVHTVWIYVSDSMRMEQWWIEGVNIAFSGASTGLSPVEAIYHLYQASVELRHYPFTLLHQNGACPQSFLKPPSYKVGA